MFVNKKTFVASYQELQCLEKNESKRIKVKKKKFFLYSKIRIFV